MSLVSILFKIGKLEVLIMSSKIPHGTVNLVVTDDLTNPDSVVITSHQATTKLSTKKQRKNKNKTTTAPTTVKSTTTVDDEGNSVLTI